MSAFGTDKWGDSLITGMLAGQKMQQFQSDFKTSELQRQLLEQTFKHNATMEPLMMAESQARRQREDVMRAGEEMKQALLASTFEAQASEMKSNAAYAGSRAEGEASKTRVAKAIESADIAGATALTQQRKSAATGAQSDALRTAISHLGDSNFEFSPYDISMLTKPVLDQLGVPDEPASRAFWTSKALGEVQGMQEKHRQNLAVIDKVQQEAQTKQINDMLANTGKAALVGMDLAAQAQADPEGFNKNIVAHEARLKTLLGNDQLAHYAMSFARAGVVSAQRTAAERKRAEAQPPEPAIDKEEAKMYSKEALDLKKEHRDALKALDVAKVGPKGALYGHNPDPAEIKAAEDEVARVEAAIAENETQRGMRRKGVNNPKSNPTGINGNSTDWMKSEDVPEIDKTLEPFVVRIRNEPVTITPASISDLNAMLETLKTRGATKSDLEFIKKKLLSKRS